MSRTPSQYRTLAANRIAAENRRKIREYYYSAKFSSAQSISIPTTFNPASFQNDWTLRVTLMYFNVSGSNQNIYAQNDGVGPGTNGRIWLLIRSTGVLSSFFSGAFQDSSYKLKHRKWYDIFLNFEFISYNPSTNNALGNLHYNVNGVDAGSVNSVSVSDAYGTHIVGMSKTSGGFLQNACIPRIELYKTGLTQEQMMDIIKNDTVFIGENDEIDSSIYEHRILFQEGSGLTAADSSGNDNHATLSHNSWSNKVPQMQRAAIV